MRTACSTLGMFPYLIRTTHDEKKFLQCTSREHTDHQGKTMIIDDHTCVCALEQRSAKKDPFRVRLPGQPFSRDPYMLLGLFRLGI